METIQAEDERDITGNVQKIIARLHSEANSDEQHDAVAALVPCFGSPLGQPINERRRTKVFGTLRPTENPKLFAMLKLALNVAEMRPGWREDIACILAMP